MVWGMGQEHGEQGWLKRIDPISYMLNQVCRQSSLLATASGY